MVNPDGLVSADVCSFLVPIEERGHDQGGNEKERNTNSCGTFVLNIASSINFLKNENFLRS